MNLISLLFYLWELLFYGKDGSSAQATDTYDYIMFAQDFPATYCHISGECTPEISAKLHPNMFKIHGLWPSLNESEGPEFCDSSRPFDLSLLSGDLQDELHHWWASYNASDSDFWAHEWDKHGTCLKVSGKDVTQPSYFQRGLEESMSRFNITEWIEAEGFRPNSTFSMSVAAMRALIKEKIGTTVSLFCEKDSTEGDMVYLSQVGICLTPQFEVADCPDFVYGRSGYTDFECQDDETFHLPTLE